MWPQITILALMFVGLGWVLANHGKYKDETYSIWWTLIATSIELFLLYKGGFFASML